MKTSESHSPGSQSPSPLFPFQPLTGIHVRSTSTRLSISSTTGHKISDIFPGSLIGTICIERLGAWSHCLSIKDDTYPDRKFSSHHLVQGTLILRPKVSIATTRLFQVPIPSPTGQDLAAIRRQDYLGSFTEFVACLADITAVICAIARS